MLAGEENAAFDRAERELHLVGDFAVFISGHIHRERYTVVVGEIFDSRRNLFSREASFRSGESRFLGKVEMIKVFGGVDDSSASDLAAIIVDKDVLHDSEDPSFEIDVVYVFRFIVKDFQRSVLHEVPELSPLLVVSW